MGFKSVGSLISWAFACLAENGASSSLGKNDPSGGIDPLAGFSPYERRAQAAQVINWISAMPIAQKACILAQFGPREQIGTVAFCLVGSVSSQYGIPAASFAIRRYFGEPSTKQQLAEKMHKSVRTADSYFLRIARELDVVRSDAYDEVQSRFAHLLDVSCFMRPMRNYGGGIDRQNCAVAL